MTQDIHIWHPTPESIAGYATATGSGVELDSVEAHLLGCEQCRAQLASITGVGRSHEGDLVWAAITDRIDRPSRWARLGPWWLRVTLGSPLLAAATGVLVAALLIVPLAVGAANPTAGATVLLALAPLAPIAGALLAYRPEIDPAGSMTGATPLASLTLILIRAAVVAGSAAPAAVVAAALLPAELSLLMGWLLPGLALSLLVLAAGTRTDPTRLAGVLALGWATAVLVAGSRLRHLPLEDMLNQLFVNQLVTQLTFTTIAALAGATVMVRRDRLEWSPR